MKRFEIMLVALAVLVASCGTEKEETRGFFYPFNDPGIDTENFYDLLGVVDDDAISADRDEYYAAKFCGVSGSNPEEFENYEGHQMIPYTDAFELKQM